MSLIEMNCDSGIKFEEVNCPLCDSAKRKPILSAPDYNFRINGIFTIVKCQECEMCYLCPRPTREDIIKVYPQIYAESYTKEEVDKFYKIFFIKRLELVESIVQKGKLLEVGCAGGYFLNLARQRGYEVMGVEIDKRSATFARKNYGISVQISPIEDANLPESYFNIIVMFDTFEHVFNPNLVLRKLKSLLAPEGYLLIKVPNFKCIESKIFRKFWYGHDLPRDLLLFSPNILKRILYENHFKNVSIKFIGEHHYAVKSFINVIKQLKRRYSEVGFKSNKEKSKENNFAVVLKSFIFYLMCYMNIPFAKFLAMLNQGNTIVAIAQKQ